MNMTHYMELLAANQPWNLILFMAIPVILAETVAITELYLLFTRRYDTWVRKLNAVAGAGAGIYFVGVIAYLMTTAVLPITAAGQWRTALDIVAVGGYLLSGLPLIAIALMEMNILHRDSDQQAKMGWHAMYVSVFLVFGHVAMIAGMADPGLLGYQGDAHAQHQMTSVTPANATPAAHAEHMHMHH